MSGIKIPVTVDLVSNLAEQVRQEANKVKTTLDSGSLGVDTANDVKQLNNLNAAAQKLKQSIKDAGSQGLDLSSVDTESALNDYLTSVTELLEKVSGLGKAKITPDMTFAIRQAKAYKQELTFSRDILKQLSQTKGWASRVVGGRDATTIERQTILEHLRRSKNPIVRQALSEGGDFEAAIHRQFSNREDAEAFAKRLAHNTALNTGIGVTSRQQEHEKEDHHPVATRGIQRFAGAMGGAMGGIVAGAGSGGMFGSIGTMAGAGIGSMVGGVPGMFLGALGGAALGSLGSQLDEAMGRAFNEALDTSRLRHALGDSSIEFARLRDLTREAGKGMQILDGESVKLTQHFAKTANVSGKQGAEGLATEMRNAYGFSNSYGLDPSRGVDFFAKMRLHGVTDDEKGSRKLGLAVAEAIGYGKNSAKSDEVLTAISNFVAQAQHMSLGAPNVESFAAMMANGTALKIPGLDVGRAAGIVGQADASFRSGGTFGESSRNFTLQALSLAHPHLSTPNLVHLMQGGADATLESVFGANSALYKGATPEEQKRLLSLVQGPNAKRKSMDISADFLRSQGGDNDWFRMSFANAYFGGNQANADAYRKMRDANQLGGLQDTLGRLGVTPEQVKPLAYGSLSDLYGNKGKKDVLDTYEARLTKGDGVAKGTKEEMAALANNKRGDEGRWEILLKAFATRDRQDTLGDRANQAQVDMADGMSRIIGEMLPATTDIKRGIFALVEQLAPETAFGKELREKQRAKIVEDNENDKARVAELDGKIKEQKAIAAGGSPESIKARAAAEAEALTKERDGLKATLSARSWAKRDAEPTAAEEFVKSFSLGSIGNSRGLSKAQRDNAARAEEIGREMGVSPSVMEAQRQLFGKESSYGTAKGIDKPNSAGAIGPMQFLPSTWSIHAKKGEDIRNMDDSIRVSYRMLMALEKKTIELGFPESKRVQALGAGYLGGDGVLTKGGGIISRADALGTRTDSYLANPSQPRDMTPIPADGEAARKRAAEQAQSINLNNNIAVTWTDPYGNAVAQPNGISYSTSWNGRAQPAGTQR